MDGSILVRFAAARVGAFESVIDDANRRARWRRAAWATVGLAALALGLGLFLTTGGGGGSAKGPSAGAAHSRSGQAATVIRSVPSHFQPIASFGGIRRPPGGAALRHKRRLLVQPTSAGPAAIWIAPDWAVRGSCAWLTIGHAVYGGECRRSEPPRRGLSEVVPLRLRVNGHAVSLIWGQVGGDVASLELRFQDGNVTRLPLTDTVFFYVVPDGRWRVGHRPARLIAREQNGRTLGKRLVWY